MLPDESRLSCEREAQTRTVRPLRCRNTFWRTNGILPYLAAPLRLPVCVTRQRKTRGLELSGRKYRWGSTSTPPEASPGEPDRRCDPCSGRAGAREVEEFCNGPDS